MNYCTNLEGLMKANNEVISRNIDAHRSALLAAGKDISYNDAVLDFIDKYAWLVRDIYCSKVCESREECSIAKRYRTDDMPAYQHECRIC